MLASRRGAQFLSSHLLRLLPYETNPIFLRVQLTKPPYWVKQAPGYADGSWFTAWNDYVEIGSGRLAELRASLNYTGYLELTSSVDYFISTNSQDERSPTTSIQLNPLNEEKWIEVQPLVDDFAANISNDDRNLKIPSALIEINLFRLVWCVELISVVHSTYVK